MSHVTICTEGKNERNDWLWKPSVLQIVWEGIGVKRKGQRQGARDCDISNRGEDVHVIQQTRFCLSSTQDRERHDCWTIEVCFVAGKMLVCKRRYSRSCRSGVHQDDFRNLASETYRGGDFDRLSEGTQFRLWRCRAYTGLQQPFVSKFV
jgi:hypothetical protein